MKKLFLIFSSILSGLLLTYLLIFKPTISLSQQNEINPPNITNKEYALTQKYNLLDTGAARGIPTVSHKPNSDKYYYVLLKEYLDSLDNYDRLFFASKRIAELEKWGKELDWKEILERYNNHIFAYWKSINNSNDENKYMEFKATLNAHYRILEKLIFFQSDDPVNNLQKMQYIDQVFNQFKTLIPKDFFISTKNFYYSLSEIAKNKDYGIYNISSQVNNNFNYLPEIQLSVKDHSYYPQITNSVDNETKQITFNNVIIDQSNLQSSVITLTLPEIKNDKPNWIKSINIQSPNSFVYKTLINNFKPGDFKLNISYAFKNPAFIRIEEQVATTESKQNINYRVDSLYQQILYPHGNSHTFIDSFSKNNTVEEILGTYITIESSIELKPDELSSISLFFTSFLSLEFSATKVADFINIKPIIKLGKINDTEYKITTINLTYDQDKNILDSLGIGWRIINRTQNRNHSEYIVSYWLKYAILIITILLILFTIGVFFYTKELYRVILHYLIYWWKLSVVKHIRYLWQIFQNICSAFRLLLFFLVILGLLIDIFVIRNNNDIIILFLTCLWILVLIGYNLEVRINFLFALFFLVLCSFLQIFKFDSIVEKFAIWVYMFLTIGTFQSIIEIRFKAKELIQYSEFLKKIVWNSIFQSIFLFLIKVILKLLYLIKHIISSIFYLLIKRIIKILKYLSKKLKRIINTKPRSIKDYVLNFIKIMFVLLFFILVFLIIIIIPLIIGFTTTQITIATHNYIIYNQKKLEDENFIKDRKSLNPVIEKVEPSIIYPSTKVILFGKGFSTRADNSRYSSMFVLKSQGNNDVNDKINTDYWDDNKIIFTVPLHWKSGLNHLWIDKPIIWNGKADVAKSNVVTVKLIPVSQTFTADDDEYFKLLPTYDKETLKINGY